MTDTPEFTLEFSLMPGLDPLAPADDVALAVTGAGSNESGAVTILVERELADMARFILSAEGAEGAWEIVTALVSDAELQALHAQFMGVDEPTDIMTFPYGDSVQGGDLAISLDHAVSRAGEWNHAPAEEVHFLVAHGVLHLLGWLDDTAEQRAVMLARQSALIQAWREATPAP